MTPDYEVSVGARLLKHVEQNANGCWIWQAATTHNGYGVLTLKAPGEPKQEVRAHRLAYQLLVGPIPEGLQLDHLCRVRRCVNPDHLEPVTPRTNTARGISPAGFPARTGQCQRAHEWALHGRINSSGNRECRECRRLSSREFARRKRAASQQVPSMTAAALQRPLRTSLHARLVDGPDENTTEGNAR